MGFQFMLILGLLGMYFDAAVVFVTKSSLLFRLALPKRQNSLPGQIKTINKGRHRRPFNLTI